MVLLQEIKYGIFSPFKAVFLNRIKICIKETINNVDYTYTFTRNVDFNEDMNRNNLCQNFSRNAMNK